jgi:hypothetical protein
MCAYHSTPFQPLSKCRNAWTFLVRAGYELVEMTAGDVLLVAAVANSFEQLDATKANERLALILQPKSFVDIHVPMTSEISPAAFRVGLNTWSSHCRRPAAGAPRK